MALTNLLQDKIVLVVGGTQGLGAAVARAAGREGAAVVVTGRRAEPAERLVAELAEAGVPAAYVLGDVADPAQARSMVEQTVAKFDRVDCLVNSAGLTTRGSLLDTTPELFDEHVATNLRGPFFTMQATVQDMLRRGEPGNIVNIITMSAKGGQPYLTPYAASKGGLITLTKNAAHAHRFDRIRINGLNIGWTLTEGEDAIQRRFHDADDGWVEEASAKQPMGKLGQPDEIADAVVFLLSERAGVVTGSVMDWDQNIPGCND